MLITAWAHGMIIGYVVGFIVGFIVRARKGEIK
jgi:hypothetical protein